MEKPLCYFDIEADGFLNEATTIWCIVAKERGVYHIYLNDRKDLALPENSIPYWDINTYKTFLSKQYLVGHNIISYDLPLLKKLHGFEYSLESSAIADTHILSRLYNPDRPEHSLAYFGDLLRYPKGDHSDWTALSQEMLDYCIRDVDLTEAVYSHLLDEGAGWNWEEAIKLEYNIWHIQQKQEQHGVLFDVPKAEQLLQVIQEEIDTIEAKVIAEIPQSYKDDGEVKKVFLKNGEYTASVKTWLENT